MDSEDINSEALAWLANLRPTPNSQLLLVKAYLAPSHGTSYEFSIINTGDVGLHKVSVNLYEALGPGDFGLDDTHMPNSMTNEPSVEIEALRPGEEVRLVKKRWGIASRYRGPASKQLFARFSESEEAPVKSYFVTLMVEGLHSNHWSKQDEA